MTNDYVTVKEAAIHHGVCTKTIYTYIREGRLKAKHYGPRLLRISIDELDSLFRPYNPKNRRSS